jgi:benzoate membrane transport protein
MSSPWNNRHHNNGRSCGLWLAGLALLRVLQNAFRTSFQGRFTLGALITFLVTLANHPLYNIGAPFWGLVFGFLASWLLERSDFSQDV